MDPNQTDNPINEPVSTPASEPTPEMPVSTSEGLSLEGQLSDTAQPVASIETAVEMPVVPESEVPAFPTQPTAPTAPLESTPLTPNTPTFSTPPVTGQPPVSAGTPVDGKPKPKKGLIIGLIAGIGGLVIIGIVLFLILVIFKGDTIGSISELKTAMKDQKAINCVISKDGDDILLQTNNDWTKVRMRMNASGQDIEVLAIDDDAAYFWSGDGDEVAYKAPYASFKSTFNELQDEIEDTSDDDDLELKCEPSSKADFKVPSDIDFVDIYDALM